MQVLVVGAGYAGTTAANRLARRARTAEVVMVNQRPDFVERIRLHQLIAGTDRAVRPLTEVLNRRVALRVASVDKVGDGVVRLDDGDELAFDRLVYAAGGAVTAPAGTLAVGGLDDARTAAQRLAALPAGSVVDVVGGGLTGVETAAEVASERPDLTVRLISDGPLADSLGEVARRRVVQVIDRLGVQRVHGAWHAGGPARRTHGSLRQGTGVSEHGQHGTVGTQCRIVGTVMTGPTDRQAPGFEEYSTHRPLLFSIAYQILGSVADAEDVLSETWLKWQHGDRSDVANPRAYLARIATRQALNAARSASRRRETYVGPWLPEPLEELSEETGLDHVLTGEAVTTAMLLVLESLTPDERAVFVLREVFDFGYPEIAAAVGKSEPAVRQIAHRARNHVRSRRTAAVADPAQAQAVVDRFLLAAATGEVQLLMDLLAPGVVYLGDGGGLAAAARFPIHGPDRVARMLVGLMKRAAVESDVDLRMTVANGMPTVVVTVDGDLDTVMSVEVADERVTAVYAVRNPEKLDAFRVTATRPDGSST